MEPPNPGTEPGIGPLTSWFPTTEPHRPGTPRRHRCAQERSRPPGCGLCPLYELGVTLRLLRGRPPRCHGSIHPCVGPPPQRPGTRTRWRGSLRQRPLRSREPVGAFPGGISGRCPQDPSVRTGEGSWCIVGAQDLPPEAVPCGGAQRPRGTAGPWDRPLVGGGHWGGGGTPRHGRSWCRSQRTPWRKGGSWTGTPPPRGRFKGHGRCRPSPPTHPRPFSSRPQTGPSRLRPEGSVAAEGAAARLGPAWIGGG